MKTKVKNMAVVGCRDFNDYRLLCLELARFEIDTIVSGGAKGADTLARRYAEGKGIKLIEFLPEYNRYGRGAPIVRNRKIVDAVDMVIAFWDGKGKGTKNVIETAEKQNKKVYVVHY